MKKWSLVALTAACACVSLSANAGYGGHGHYYVSGKVGYASALDFTSATFNAAPLNANGVDIEFDGDVVWGGALGYAYKTHGLLQPRAEFEINYQQNDVNHFNVGSGSVFGDSGDFELTTYMVNGLVDIDLGPNCIKPYFGVGIGFGNVEAHVSQPMMTYNDGETTFAMQGIIGVGYDIEAFTLFVEGKYVHVNNPEFVYTTTNGSTNHRGGFNSINVLGGVAFNFG